MGFPPFRGLGDLLRQRSIDFLPLADDEEPVVRRRVDRAMELGAVFRDRIARRHVEGEDLHRHEVRAQRHHVLRVDVAEGNDGEAGHGGQKVRRSEGRRQKAEMPQRGFYPSAFCLLPSAC